MCKRILPLLFATVCAAQTLPHNRNSFTNRDISILAKAGFSEEFILDAIAGARTHFDVAAEDLAALAREGVSETIVRAMLVTPKPPVSVSAGPVETPPEPATHPASVKGKSAKKSKSVPKEPKPTTVELAMKSHTPYYESSSSLFGLSRKQISVGAATAEDHKVDPQLGAIYQQVKANQ
jgi:hypothetical protein